MNSQQLESSLSDVKTLGISQLGNRFEARALYEPKVGEDEVDSALGHDGDCDEAD